MISFKEKSSHDKTKNQELRKAMLTPIETHKNIGTPILIKHRKHEILKKLSIAIFRKNNEKSSQIFEETSFST